MSTLTKTEDANSTLDRWAERELEKAPPLTDEQRHRIAALFKGGERR